MPREQGQRASLGRTTFKERHLGNGGRRGGKKGRRERGVWFTGARLGALRNLESRVAFVEIACIDTRTRTHSTKKGILHIVGNAGPKIDRWHQR